MDIGGVHISNYDTKLSPVDNYKAALLAEIITTNKAKIKLRKAFAEAENILGQRIINGQVVLNKIDFELWIKANINDDSMVCLGDKIIREIKRMYDQLEGNIKLVFENPAAAYDKLEDGVKDAGRWIDDEILQGLDEFFGSPIAGLGHALDDIFDNPYYITTYLCKYQGQGKNDPMLIALYDLKRNYAFKNKEYVANLIVYDKIARCLIKKCLRDNPLAQVYYHDKLVVQTYNLVMENKKEDACQHYIKVVLEMVESYD